MGLAEFPIPDDEDLESNFPATEEAIEPVENSHGRLLAGLPDRYNWANSDTHRCANEGGWCACDGNVVYTKKCKGTFSCSQANWGEVVYRRWNSNHKSDVSGGIWCNNGNLEAIHFQDMTSNVSVIQNRLLQVNTITFRSGREKNATPLVEDLAQTGGAMIFGKESGVVFLALELALSEQPHLWQVVNIHIP